MGIWKPIYLIGGDAPFTLDEILWKTDVVGSQWEVEVTLIFGRLAEGDCGMTGEMNVTLEGIGTYTQCKQV